MEAGSMGLTWAETRRKLAHMAAFWPAFLLPWMSPIQALAMAFALVLMNMFILPRAAPGLYRDGASGRGALEIILYPAALMACVIAFAGPYATAEGAAAGTWPAMGGEGKRAWYLPAAAAWFALAFVDAFIGFACRLVPKGPSLPWNRRKPALGMLLGALAACLPAWILARWAMPALEPAAWAALGLLLLAAALAETAWFGVADNLIIPFFVCILIPLFPNPLSAAAAFPSLSWIWIIPAAFGLAAYAGRMLTAGGALLGAVMALLLVLADPWLFVFLGGFFALANAATRFGRARKESLGIAEARRGRRGAAEVFGAMGLAAWMTPLVHLGGRGQEAGIGAPGEPGPLALALLVCVAPLIAKTMDTVSSEIGKATAGRTISLRSLRLVPPGTEGGVSLAGTLAGLGAAMLIATGILPLGWGGWSEVAALTVIAVAANVFESLWGEWAARKDMNQGPHANVLMTLVAAVLAWMLWIA